MPLGYTGSELAGQLPPLLVRPHAAASLKRARRRSRAVHRRRAYRDHRGSRGLARLLPIISEKLDPSEAGTCSRKYRKANSPQEAIEILKQRGSLRPRRAHAASLAPLTKAEVRELSSYIYPVMVANNTQAHTLNDRGTGRHAWSTSWRRWTAPRGW